MKKSVFIITCTLLSIATLAQPSNYFYVGDSAYYWTTDSSSVIFIVKNMENYNAIVNNLNNIFKETTDEILEDDEDDNIILYSNSLRNINLNSLVSTISTKSDDISFASYSKIIGDEHLWLRNEVYIKLSDITKYNQYLVDLFSTYSVISSNFEGDNEYLLKFENEQLMMQFANRFNDSSWVEYSTPDFYSDTYLCSYTPSDPLYFYQWGLKSTSPSIKTEPAWDFIYNATGALGSNKRIAIVDHGIQNHIDFNNNNILVGYTANNNGYGEACYDCHHGIKCAGVIAAQHNNTYIAGISPDSKIIPIRIFKKNNSAYSSAAIAKCITKAWSDFNAEVISNSWGGGIPNAKLNNAINKAITNGRNGKGCVVVFSAGNKNKSHVEYPSGRDGVIAVGSINYCGYRAGTSDVSNIPYCNGNWYGDNQASSYGEKLSIVAPGSHIYTLDINNDYFTNFCGTSSAAPHVSGVAALMLSANPNLTTNQVKAIIEQTAQKIHYNTSYIYTYGPSLHPNGEWNNEVGYGLIDAHKAVMEAYFYNHAIEGDYNISSCNEYTYSLSSTIPNGTSLTWEISNNMEIVSGQGTSNIVVRPIGNGGGWIKAKLEHENNIVTKSKNVLISPGASTYYNNYTTNGTITFTSDLVIAGTFTISNGSIVTISSTAYCSPSTRIVICPGGKLIVDGGTFTNLCPDKMWKGIRVLGNKNQRQLAQYQGTLEIKNGSVIANAKDAISTWDGDDYNTTGGIVKCTNSTFLNNRRSAEFMAYTNHDASNQECSNVSYFTLCNFIVNDNNMFEANNATFGSFITMWGVNGIKLKGCTFDDQCTTPHTTCHAIGTADAGYSLTEYCSNFNPRLSCNCLATPVRSSVKNVAMGVDASNSGTNYAPNINRTDFDACGVAAYISAINSFRFTENSIKMFSTDVFSAGLYAGLYMETSSGYKVEGNDFYSVNSTYPSNFGNIGIMVSASGNDYNAIYRNTFDKLNIGILSGNNNGLQFQCNDFSSSFDADLNILSGISPVQGSSAKSAGNKFTSGVPNISTFSSNALTYYYSGTNVPSNSYYPASVSSNVTLADNSTANDCSSTLCNIIPPINPPIVGPVIDKSAPSNDDISLYESLQQIYESRLADYNTVGYGFLLENFEENNADIVATARLMQDTLISIRRTMAEIANRNIDAILQDTIVFDREALNGWYNRINTQTAKYSLVNSYFEVGEYALARQELASILQRFALTADELADYDNFCQYQSLREAVYTDGRNYAQLTEDEIAELQVIVERNTGVSSAYANSVLCFFYGICRDEEIDIDFDIDAPMNSKSTTEVVEENAEPLAIYVYPNPADEKLNILLNSLPEGRTMIEFHDVAGRLVLSEEIKSANTSINISSLKQGVYMYRIVNGDSVIARDRIVKE